MSVKCFINASEPTVQDFSDEAQACDGLTWNSCHGYCIDIMGCTNKDILLEYDFVLPIFDWQNLIFLLFIIVIMKVGRWLFRRMYQVHISAELASRSKRGSVNQVADEQTALAGEADAAAGAPEGPRMVREKSMRVAWDEAHHSKWWDQAREEPAVLICLAAFLYSISNISFGAITEFDSGGELYEHVGFDTAYGAFGVNATVLPRLENVGFGVLWTVVGMIFMIIAQVILRHLTFRGMEQSLVGEVMEGALGEDHKEKGSNVAAAVVEAGGVVSAGLIAAANISGAPSDDQWLDLLAAVAFFLLSQLSLMVFMKVFDCFFIHGTVEDALEKELPEAQWIHLPRDQICKKGNVAVAISHASMSVAFALLVSRATYSSFELASFGVFVVVGGTVQLLMRPVVDKLIVPSVKLDDELDTKMNWGMAAVVGSLQIYVARVISSLVDDTCEDFVYSGDFYCAESGLNCRSGFLPHDAAAEGVDDISFVCWDDETVCLNEDTWPAGFVNGVESSCQQSATMPLGERVVQTEMALKFFQPKLPLQLLIATLFLLGAKYAYSLPYCLCSSEPEPPPPGAPDAGATEVPRTNSGTPVVSFKLVPAITDHTKHAVSISFSAYIFGVGTIIQGLFKDVRLGYFAALVDDDCGDNLGGVNATEYFCSSTNMQGLGQVGEDALWALAGLLMMMVTQLLSEMVVLHWAKDSRELMTRDNRALACIEGGMYVGSGFIIAAVMQAETFVLSLIFFGLGELAMVLFSFLYQYWTKFDDRRAVEQKNIAAGLHWGMSQAALGLLLARAIYLSNSVSAPAGLWLLPTLKGNRCCGHRLSFSASGLLLARRTPTVSPSAPSRARARSGVAMDGQAA